MIGPLAAGVLAVGVGLTESWHVGIAAGICVLGVRLLEDYLILPRVLGDAVGLSPLLVLVSVTSVGILFGAFAVILAVPLVAVLVTVLVTVLGGSLTVVVLITVFWVTAWGVVVGLGAGAAQAQAQQKVTATLIEAGDYPTALREAQYLASKAPADPVGRRLLETARAHSR